MQVNLTPEALASLQVVLDYVFPGEADNFDGEDDHIFHDINTVQRWLESITPDTPRRALSDKEMKVLAEQNVA